jgi:hypothetical protein
MSIICFSATVATAGTPQNLASTASPAQPTINMGGTTFAAASATLRGAQIQLQAAPGNTAAKNIYVGSKGMVVGTKAGCGMTLLTGTQPISLGQFGGLEDLADLWIDTDAGTNGTEKILVTVVA